MVQPVHSKSPSPELTEEEARFLQVNPEGFFRDILAHLTDLLQDVVGTDLSEGFVGTIGTQIARKVGQSYDAALGPGQNCQDLHRLAKELVDFKRRIGGNFSVESITDTRIVLVNDRCPFGRMVVGKTPLCMMTMNVFGHFAANRMGSAHVTAAKTIARGHGGCRVIIDIGSDAEAIGDGGQTYYAD